MRTLILGLDAFDPARFERLLEEGRLPNLARYVRRNAYRRLKVTDPPQSEVSWTSIASGLPPGDHGIFDFVHRDPQTYRPYLSLLPTERKLGAVQFGPPTRVSTLFDRAASLGFPATRLFWPATFPADLGSPVRTIPGLGTPDIHGKLGTGTLFASDSEDHEGLEKVGFSPLSRHTEGTYRGTLEGPARKKGLAPDNPTVEFEFQIVDKKSARLNLGGRSVELKHGTWSPILEVEFRMGWFYSLRAVTRAIWTQSEPATRLYYLPLQIHPLHSPWHYGAPRDFLRNHWSHSGPYLTLGWPQDTTGLEEGCLSDEQFLELCDSIFAFRQQALFEELERFDEGVLAIVLDSLDRIQHMFWRDRPDVVDRWYAKLDEFIGRAERLLDRQSAKPAQLLILSDHGFCAFDQKVHLNRWLEENRYLKQLNGDGRTGYAFTDIDWTQSHAYALGLNSIYLNKQGREAQGTVSDRESEELLGKLSGELTSWTGPDGKQVVKGAQLGREVFRGTQEEYAPDLVIGYTPGYRASAETGLGNWAVRSIVHNRDHWNADHCVDSNSVPGVLFARHGLENIEYASYRDIPRLAIGVDPDASRPFPAPKPAEEEMEVVEERLRSLGYL